jgi:hypothetical protein
MMTDRQTIHKACINTDKRNRRLHDMWRRCQWPCGRNRIHAAFMRNQAHFKKLDQQFKAVSQ